MLEDLIMAAVNQATREMERPCRGRWARWPPVCLGSSGRGRARCPPRRPLRPVDRRAGPAAVDRPQDRGAHRPPPAQGSAADARRLADAIVEVKEKLFHCSTCNSITPVDPAHLLGPRPAARPDLRRRRAFQHRAGGAHRRVPRPLPRPARGVAAPPRHRPRPARHRQPPRPARRRPRGGAGHQPQRRGGGDGPLSRPRAQAPPCPVTRLAFGMPVGGDIEYTDEVTLALSLAGRREL